MLLVNCLKLSRQFAEYFNTWDQQEGSDRMYPCGVRFCDIDGTGYSIITIPFAVPFYGGSYGALNVGLV